MLKRAITGTFFVAALIIGYLFDKHVAWALTFLIAVLGLAEFKRVIQENTDYRIPFIFWLVPIALAGYFFPVDLIIPPSFFLGIFIVILPLSMIVELFKSDNPYAIQNISIGLLGAFYASFIFLLYAAGFDANLTYKGTTILGIFILIWSNDTFAYLFGKYFGKHKLFERISPKKTWEGSIGGGLSALLIAWILAQYFHQFSWIEWLIIGIFSVIFGSLGDLVESMFKRQLKIKDSGNLLPGHGGILDRFDATLMVAPFVYFLIHFAL